MDFRKLLQSLVLWLFTLCGVGQGSLFAQIPAFDWAKSVSDKGQFGLVQAAALATDITGSAYIAGYYQCDSADFDPGSGAAYIYSSGAYDAFVCKLDVVGDFQWAKSIAGASDSRAQDVFTDSQNNVYVTGYFTGTISLDSFSLTTNGGYDAFVCKMDSAGNVLWARNLGGTGTDYGKGISTDQTGNVYVTGQFTGSGDFDFGTGSVLLTSNGYYDIFICKLDAQGNFQWAKSMGGTGNDQGRSVSVDLAGNVYTTGVFQVDVDFDPGPEAVILSTSGEYDFDIFVNKLDATGNYIWTKRIGGASPGDNGNDIAVNATAVYITGMFDGIVDFDPGSGVAEIVSNGSLDAFVCKLDTAGEYIWSGNFGGTNADQGNHIDLDAVGNVYLMAQFEHSADFDPGSGVVNIYGNGFDIGVAKLDASGNYLWAGRVGSRSTEYSGGIGLSSGNIYMAGTFFSDTLDADATNGYFQILPASVGEYSGDIFISKLFCTDTNSLVVNIDTCARNFTFNGEEYTTSGIYAQKYPNVLGCDSTVILHLTITLIDPVITVDEFVLGTVVPYDAYQWLLNGEIIPGATESTYMVIENGDYQVVVESGPCSDTSAIYIVDNVSVEEVGAGQHARIYPNPATDRVYIQAPAAVGVSIRSIDGRFIREIKETKTFSVADLPAGIYMLHLKDTKGKWQQVEKLVKRK